MSLKEKLSSVFKKPSKKSVTINNVKIEPGKGQFRLEYLSFRTKAGLPRKTWRKLLSMDVTEENIALAQPDGYKEIDRDSWAEAVRKVENELMFSGIDPEALDYKIFRLKYVGEPPNSSSIVIWKVGVTVDEEGNVDFDPDPSEPSPYDLMPPNWEKEVTEQKVFEPAPLDPFEQLRDMMQKFQEITQMQREMQKVIAQAFGLPDPEQKNDKFSALRELLEEMRQYEELKKQLGMGEQKDVMDKMLDKMPWWAGFLMFSLQNLSPLLSLLGPMTMMQNPMMNPYVPHYPQYPSYPPQNPYYPQPTPTGQPMGQPAGQPTGQPAVLPPKPAPPRSSPRPQAGGELPDRRAIVEPAETPKPEIRSAPKFPVVEEVERPRPPEPPRPPKKEETKPPEPPRPRPRPRELIPDEYKIDPKEALEEFERLINDDENVLNEDEEMRQNDTEGDGE